MKKQTLLFTFIFSINLVFGQDSFSAKFTDANLSLEEKKYEQALIIWNELLNQDPENANINYKVGLCYRNLALEKRRALPFLEKAATGVTKNYDIFSAGEKNAPVEVLFHLASAYHIEGKLDDAEDMYEKFMTEVPKKHSLYEQAEKGIKDCATAREFMSSALDVTIESMGDQVNTVYSEHSPVLSLDENILFFTSRRLREDSANFNFIDEASGKYFEDIYVSYKNENGTWGKPELLSFSRKDGHDATVSLHPDGQKLYIYRDDFGNGTLYESKIVDDVWTLPVMMESNINTPKSFESHLSVANDGKTLYFASDRKGGYGGVDIYMCKKLPNGKWGLAVNLGDKINTKYDENSPFMHPDGKTLYFTSEGHKNMGGYDIFYSVVTEEGMWSEPTNMGYPINTTDDEETFTTSPDGRRAYYSSYKAGGFGEGDLYKIYLNQAEETGLTLVKGKIMIPEGTEFPKDVRILLKDNETGDLIAESRPLKRNGSFVFIVPPGKNYNVTYEINGKEFYEENTFVPKGTEYKVIQKEVPLDPLKLDAEQSGTLVVKNAAQNMEPKWQLRYPKTQQKLAEGQSVLYLSETGDKVLHEELVDANGFFKYHKIANNAFQFKLHNLKDYTLCDEGEIVLVGGENKEVITLVPDMNCIFTPYNKTSAKILSYGGKSLPSGAQAVYTDQSGKVLKTSTIDPFGNFEYFAIPSGQEYRVNVEKNGVVDCADLLILISSENNKRHYLSSDNTCAFKPYQAEQFTYVGTSPLNNAVKALYLNEDGTILFEEEVTNNLFRHRRLPFDKPLRVKFTENDQTLCKGGEIHYVRKDGSGYKLKSEDDCIYKVYDIMEPTKDKQIVAFAPVKVETPVTSSPSKDEKPMTAEEKKDQQIMDKFENSLVQNTKSAVDLSYKMNFEYNKNKINTQDAKFKKFVKSAVALYKLKGSVDIAVESGASKVPTKSFNSNDELARTRAYQAKDLIIEELVKAGVNKDKINTRDITYLVQGPDYNKDPQNLKLYRPFQYVKLWVTNNE